MHTVTFLDRDTIDPNIVIEIPPNVEWQNYDQTDPSDVVERLKHSDIVVTNKVELMADVLKELPSLKHIALTATGMNNVDLNYCQEHGISVSNVKGYGSISVAEHGFMMLLALRRNLLSYVKDVNAGLWESSDKFCHYPEPLYDLDGTTLMLVGKGDIGQTLAKRAEAFGMNVLWAERKGASSIRPSYTAFEQAIQEADHIMLSCPLTESTKNLIGENEFQQMKANTVIINLARGGIVNEQDFVNAIEQGTIAGGATDVAEQEPLTSNSPLTRLKHRNNVIITPHVAWASMKAQTRLMREVVNNIQGFIKSSP